MEPGVWNLCWNFRKFESNCSLLEWKNQYVCVKITSLIFSSPISVFQPGVSAPQPGVNPIAAQQGVPNKVVAWSGVLEWQEVRRCICVCVCVCSIYLWWVSEVQRSNIPWLKSMGWRSGNDSPTTHRWRSNASVTNGAGTSRSNDLFLLIFNYTNKNPSARETQLPDFTRWFFFRPTQPGEDGGANTLISGNHGTPEIT